MEVSFLGYIRKNQAHIRLSQSYLGKWQNFQMTRVVNINLFFLKPFSSFA